MLAGSVNGGDCDAAYPDVVRHHQKIYGVHVTALAVHAVMQLLHIFLERLNGRQIRLQEGLAWGVLVVAYAGLLVGDHGGDEIDGGNVLIDSFNPVDGCPGVEDLPDQHRRQQKQSDHRQEECLRQNPVELIQVHVMPSMANILIRQEAF